MEQKQRILLERSKAQGAATPALHHPIEAQPGGLPHVVLGGLTVTRSDSDTRRVRAVDYRFRGNDDLQGMPSPVSSFPRKRESTSAV